MDHLARKYRHYFSEREFRISAFVAFFLLAASLFVNYYAGMYATDRASYPVTDFILSNIRTFDVDGVFIYGTIVFWLFIVALVLYEPARVPFTFKSIALFVLVRSVFISLTHIGPFPTQAHIDPSFLASIVEKFTFTGDLFFSGHTGLAFLMALIFWKNIRLRVFFVAASLIFGVIVLLGHLHYSIDVLAAFFITYTIYRIAEIIFPRDKLIFEGVS